MSCYRLEGRSFQGHIQAARCPARDGRVQAWELFTPPTAGAARPWLSNSEMSTPYSGSLLKMTYLSAKIAFLSFTHLLEEHKAAKLAGP